MKILDPSIRRAAIEKSIRAARHPGHDPARWALPLVAAADAQAGGAWQHVALVGSEAWTLWLPPHAGEACHGDTMPLAGGRGTFLEDAVTWLGAHADAYARANPSCWQRIAAARDGAWGPIVATPFPVGDRTGPPEGVVASGIVIDGLHRALGWGLRRRAGRTPRPAHAASPDGDLALEAFIPTIASPTDS